MRAIFQATRGNLRAAADALAAATHVGLITGFFIPNGRPPAAETDGPAATALLARAFHQTGIPCRVATDSECASACAAALRAAGAASALDSIAPHQDPAPLIDRWRDAGISHVIAVERCGPNAEGGVRNMRGLEIAAHVAPLDRLFVAGPWSTIAIGDGGNELGMGSLPPTLIADNVPLGQEIGCIVPADTLITAGVSHWGAYALLAALALQRPDWAGAMRAALDPALDEAIIAAMVADGPAVDGVSFDRAPTIDTLPMARHHEVLHAIRRIIDGR
jgi:D-glutamate cyclase